MCITVDNSCPLYMRITMSILLNTSYTSKDLQVQVAAKLPKILIYNGAPKCKTGKRGNGNARTDWLWKADQS